MLKNPAYFLALFGDLQKNFHLSGEIF